MIPTQAPRAATIATTTPAPRRGRRTWRVLTRLGVVVAAASVVVPATATTTVSAATGAASPAVVELAPDAFEYVDTPDGPVLVPTATTQQNVIILTNQQRARVGAPPVRYSQALTISAQRHANDMAKMRRLTHTGSDGSSAGTRMRRAGYAWSRCAENAAVGQTGSSQVVQAWMASSGHRANMLNRSYTHIGIGLAWGNGRIWWVMDLAA